MTKVVEKKLGRSKALGQVYSDHPKAIIYIDPRQSEKAYLGTLIHEKLHILDPDMGERKILKWEKQLTNLLWESGYRKQ